MLMAALQALLSHWKRRPLQLLTLVLGIALATALWSGVQAINAEARKSYDDAAEVLGGDPVIVDPSGGRIPAETFAALRRAGWLVSPVIEGRIAGDRGSIRLFGVDPFTMSRGPASEATETVEFGAFLGEEGVLLAAPATAARMQRYGNRVQIVEGLAPGLALADLSAARVLLERSDFDRLTVAAEQPLTQTPLEQIAPQLQIDQPDTAEDLARLTDSFHLTLTAFGFLSFAVGLFIVNGAVGLAFEQRRPMFRTLRALGMTARTLVGLLIVEVLIIAVAAGALGVLLGYGIAAFLLPDVAATLRGLYGASVEGVLTLSPTWWVSGLAIAVFGTALAALGSLIKVARLSPLAAARPRAWLMATQGTIRLQALLAAACFGVALIAGTIGSGLVGGFVLLGGLLLGAALLLPMFLGLVLLLAGRLSKGVTTEWFWADTRQQLPGLSLALMALLLALSANIGVGTMVGSFRETFVGWLDQRLVSELYVSLETAEDLPAFCDFVEGRVETILPIWNTKVEILGAPGEIFGVVDHETYRNNWPLLSALPDVWPLVNTGDGVLVNEQLARRESLAPGDTIPMPGGWSTTVAGVYSDYGNPLGQVILQLETLTTRYDNVEQTEFGLRLAPDGVDNLSADLVEGFGLPENNIVDQAALKVFSVSVFERTFAVTGALNVLTLAVAGFAMLTSLLTLASMRLPQLAPVWAIGIPRTRLAWIEVVRTVILAILTFALALPVGLMLAWVLLAVINVEAFGWRLPMHLFPGEWSRLAGLAVVAAALAAFWPARVLARRPPSDLIRVFAHEH